MLYSCTVFLVGIIIAVRDDTKKASGAIGGRRSAWCQIDQNINQFWPLVSKLVGEDLAALPYAARLPRLLAHGFGLWDLLGACQREGSLDANIRQPAANDFGRLRELARCWKRSASTARRPASSRRNLPPRATAP